jgi:hypothetical protein
MWGVTSVDRIAVASVGGGGDTRDARETSIAECRGVVGYGREGVERGGLVGG